MTALNIQQALAPVTHEGNPMIDARALHGWLGNKKHFNDWVKARIEDYGFAEGTDFYTEKCKTGGRPRVDYLLTVDMAKELSMVERTDRGRETRQYFIQMEKAAREMAADHIANGIAEAIPESFDKGMELAERLTGMMEQQQAFMAEQAKVMAALVERISSTSNVVPHPALKEAAAPRPAEKTWVSARDAYFMMSKESLFPCGAQLSRAVSPLGQQLSEACRQRGIQWREIDRWGTPTRHYPVELLTELYGY